MFSSSPSTKTARPAQPKISHRLCGPDTTSSPFGRGEEENPEKIYIITYILTSHLGPDFENKQRKHMPKQTRKKPHY